MEMREGGIRRQGRPDREHGQAPRLDEIMLKPAVSDCVKAVR
jgi:hypothetical protein